MATAAKLVRVLERGEKRHAKAESIDPKLKQFIDRVVAPILVQEYLQIIGREKEIAESSDRMSLCPATADNPHVEVAQ